MGVIIENGKHKTLRSTTIQSVGVDVQNGEARFAGVESEKRGQVESKNQGTMKTGNV